MTTDEQRKAALQVLLDIYYNTPEGGDYSALAALVMDLFTICDDRELPFFEIVENCKTQIIIGWRGAK